MFDASITGLNAACAPWPFHYTGVAAATARLRRHDFLVKIDLAKWFTQLPIHPAFQDFLGFRWRGKYYVFTSVPFGLTHAPAFASWVSAEITAIARERGIPVAATYIDDFLLHAPNYASAVAARDSFLALLHELGVEYGKDKVEGPAQCLPLPAFHLTRSVPRCRFQRSGPTQQSPPARRHPATPATPLLRSPSWPSRLDHPRSQRPRCAPFFPKCIASQPQRMSAPPACLPPSRQRLPPFSPPPFAALPRSPRCFHPAPAYCSAPTLVGP